VRTLVPLPTLLTALEDAHPRVVGYSAFSTMQNLQGVAEVNRMSVGSQPNALFRLYAGLN